MNFDFEGTLSSIARIGDQAARKKAELYTFEGNPHWEPAEMERMTEAALAPLRAAVAQANDLAGRAESYADTLDAGAYGDPLATVDNETLQRMGLLSQFVREEIEGMTMTGLANRLRGVVAHGDDATKRLYLRYAKINHDQHGAGQVVKLLDQLDDAINGAERARWAKETERAQELRAKAASLQVNASQRLAALDGTAERRNRERLAAIGGPM